MCVGSARSCRSRGGLLVCEDVYALGHRAVRSGRVPVRQPVISLCVRCARGPIWLLPPNLFDSTTLCVAERSPPSYVCPVAMVLPRLPRGRFEEQERAAASGGKQKEDVSDIVAEENRKRKRKLEKKEKEKAGDKGKRYKDSFKF